MGFSAFEYYLDLGGRCHLLVCLRQQTVLGWPCFCIPKDSHKDVETVALFASKLIVLEAAYEMIPPSRPALSTLAWFRRHFKPRL